MVLVIALAGMYQAGLLRGFQVPFGTLPSNNGTGTTSYVTTQPTGTSTSTSTTSTVQPVVISDLWVQQFIANVNTYRASIGGSALVYDPKLSQFAQERFNTSAAEFTISHYGYNQDASCFFVNCIPLPDLGGANYVLNLTVLDKVLGQGAYQTLPSGFSGSYWRLVLTSPYGVSETVYFTTESAITSYITGTYGSLTSITFNPDGSFLVKFPATPSEEVLFPDGFTPDTYPNNLQTKAPGHWGGLIDKSVTYYGYYLHQGPTLAVESTCSVTEIPGPNINVTQLYLDNGCHPTVDYATWFVIEMNSQP